MGKRQSLAELAADIEREARARALIGFNSGIVGTTVARSWDDSPVPLTGRVTGQLDEDRLEVAWADEQYSDDPRVTVEWFDELRPVRNTGEI